LLSAAGIAAADPEQLRQLIRPAGFAASKTQYLQNVATYFEEHGGVARLSQIETSGLREALLSIRGIGPETADAILLYVFARPVWIIDAYSTRLFSRLWDVASGRAYQLGLFSAWLNSGRSNDLQELHALIVEHSKRRCRIRPQCDGCPLCRTCTYGRGERC
jgi:endonuclease-3 related protein